MMVVLALTLLGLLPVGCAPRYAVEAIPVGHGWVRCEYRQVLVDEDGNRSLGDGWDVYQKGESCPTYWTPN